ncbi:response regulator [Microcoleus sp. FACHB-672]|uniref:hybrid sensor histidine kinase/response regulator n=1 Tax=Microcoleus sp. FACHB-672 TaxID=2692825 RepID=UPI001688038D|nr:response regulator [Microcoleus sp. FACHB-672]MBD2043331.1 response regulator [Microcoleus sp. FACHB-672]
MSNESSQETGIVLIVDDNPANLGVLSDFLDEAGFEVWVARDGESALRKVEYDPPDIILLDVMMPGIDGFETCRRLQSSPSTKDIPVIFMTALSDTVDKVKGLSLGAVDYITKPLQQEEVLARVRLHLKLRNMTKTLAAQNAQLIREVEARAAAEVALIELTQQLEQRVDERTLELKNALQNLQKTQIQLIQSEKLATLGQLLAGVAHEINNPVSSISGNLSHMVTASTDLINHLQLYQQHYPNSLPKIEEHAESIELEYIVEDIPQILNSMKFGTERIRCLSVSLRNFYRTDTSSKVPVNIHEGLDSTLLILQHRLKASSNHPAIEVIKEYGNLPAVNCYPGQLNQVFMNLLANAIDALEEAVVNGQLSVIEGTAKNTPTIWISTEVLEGNYVDIRVKDNAAGINQETQKHLFEPMFTTKPVGKGTGLGLSISREIVEEKHGGRLKCISSPGQGTQFVLEIPIHQSE